MLAVLRLIAIALFILFSCIFGFILCLVRPFHKNNVHIIASWYGKVAGLLGVKVVVERSPELDDIDTAVYIANHQNNYDIFLIPNVVPKNTVSLGKKSLKWIPFFGQLYWLSGNILIDRANRTKALNTISQTTEKIKQKGLSLWMFPEGTRSYGRGLLPFKPGAFHTAMNANVPIVPVCMNTTHKTIKLNRLNNGTIYIKILPPQLLDQTISARDHAKAYHQLMQTTIAQLDERDK